jgi:hypothetical protein
MLLYSNDSNGAFRKLDDAFAEIFGKAETASQSEPAGNRHPYPMPDIARRELTVSKDL